MVIAVLQMKTTKTWGSLTSSVRRMTVDDFTHWFLWFREEAQLGLPTSPGYQLVTESKEESRGKPFNPILQFARSETSPEKESDFVNITQQSIALGPSDPRLTFPCLWTERQDTVLYPRLSLQFQQEMFLCITPGSV